MKQPLITVLLINMGTPDSFKRKDVRKYLAQFLGDKRIISIPWLLRKILVNIIIVPFRTVKVAKLYQKLWTEKGSPLLYYGERIKQLLQETLPSNYNVELGMRYGNPSIESVMKKVEQQQPNRLIVVPLYPHYASSTIGACVEKVMQIMKKWNTIIPLKVAAPFFNHKDYIGTMVNNAKQHNLDEIEHFVFSFHGLPLSHIRKNHLKGDCESHQCKNIINEKNRFCYQAQCYETARLLAKELNITDLQYTVTFQSRINKRWLQPFTDHVLVDMARKGIKKVMVFSPSFVADCLETIIEINYELKNQFIANGGEELVLVEVLNDKPQWINCLKDIVEEG